MPKGVNLKQRMLIGAASGAMLILGAPSFAQEAAEPVEKTEGEQKVLDVITVTGIKSSIENSLATKRESNSIIEAISAEDIGRLPDLSIADSLARLPGVTAQRVRGRSQQVSIRGLGPDFSLALLNGREVVSAGNNRGVEFDQFPSELVAKGIVYKSPDAQLAATGIAGAVDLRTVRPLDYNERKINVSGKYVLNDSGELNPDYEDTGYRLFGSYIDQNEDGTIGWSLAATQQSNPTHYTTRELKTNGGQTSIDDVTGLVYPSDNPRTGVVSREFERTSIAGALQFEPTDNWRTSIDAFYTDTEDAGIFRGVETPIASWSGASFDSATGSNGFADSATYTDVSPIVRTDTEGNTAEIWALGINTQYDVSDNLTLTLDLARSTLERNDIDYESYAGIGAARSGTLDTLKFNFDPDGEYSIDHDVDYTDSANVLLTDPGGWGQVGFIKEPKIEDELDQIRVEAEYFLNSGFISSVKAGAFSTQREKNFDSNEAFLRATDAFGNGLVLPRSAIRGITDSGSIGLDILAYDPASLIADGTYVVEPANGTRWTLEEDLMTYFAMANIDTQLGSVPMRGNFGFQYVDTTQESTGTLNFGANQFSQTVEDSYSNFLPSLNLNFEVTEDTFIRFAAAQTVTRPRLDQLAANQNLDSNPISCVSTDGDQLPDVLVTFDPPETVCFTQSGGNPFLQPYKSTAFDLAFEKYFDSTTALSVALFHKELSDWVVDRNTMIDGTQSLIAGGHGDFLAANPEVSQVRLSGPVNFAEGSITGIEATFRMNLDNILPPALEGFGFNASYTYADNGLETENGDELPIPGYSDTVWSGDFYYENYGWRARVSARYRSDFLSEVQNFDGSLAGAQALEETIVDLQVGYEWDSGKLEGLALNFEVFNLTDEPFATSNDTALDGVSYISRHEQYGTTYNFTVSKSF
ncbi:TonB-dependent receptor [Hirschia litorea]|uniref:TonB-dependent receptor n=1 Tax=Hirschia litorea TaxID=1199156 RepID=A0ABW2IPP9_9PROT